MTLLPGMQGGNVRGLGFFLGLTTLCYDNVFIEHSCCSASDTLKMWTVQLDSPHLKFHGD